MPSHCGSEEEKGGTNRNEETDLVASLANWACCRRGGQVKISRGLLGSFRLTLQGRDVCSGRGQRA